MRSFDSIMDTLSDMLTEEEMVRLCEIHKIEIEILDSFLEPNKKMKIN
tara:strand:- start:387 stop:530 length:144 start_codon:yes stop_codon:yes gene_type:complete